jgi:hypothetical protein
LHGFDPIGTSPNSNVIFTPFGVRLTNVEFWRECDPGTRLDQCYCLAGLPKAYAGDRPPGQLWLFDPYDSQWFQHTALDLRSFLDDSRLMQRLKRARNLTTRYIKWRARSALRSRLKWLKARRRSN